MAASKDQLNKWEEVDNYFNQLFIPSDSVLEATLADSDAAGLPPANVAPNQGKFLHLLVKIQGARTVLEIGTLGGYSTIWIARALPPGGKLVTLETSQKHADTARKNIERAQLSHVVEIIVGPAIETLQSFVAKSHEKFDFVFIDADKTNNVHYFEYSMQLTHSGSVIVADNVVRNGTVVDTESDDISVKGIQRFSEQVAKDKRVSATAIQTVGCKGYDGFAILRVL